MTTAIKTRIIRIGNSQGVRIPKALLDQTDFKEEVELILEQGKIVIRPALRPRQNWDMQFKMMAEQGDDRLLDGDVPSSTAWDEEEWEW